ncbi:MAG TPA: murein biosynthesis integral membrane protein MurJ [Candidatus Limnocylindria bacterium]|nr:murein biosynthesis integral membrane protein MurJ [Candidatus Limnocylindria bacterium]
MSRILTSTGAASTATLISRVLGFVREFAFAAFLGTGPIADAFYMALQLPNLVRRFVGEGALTAAFIPMLQEERMDGDAKGWQFANRALSLLVVLLGTFSALVMILASLLLWFAAKGWVTQFDIDTLLMFSLLRDMSPYIPLACLTAVFIGILNAVGRFFLPIVSSAVLNVVLIATVWWVAPRFGTELYQQVYALAFGLVVAGAVQAICQLPGLRQAGFRLAWDFNWKDPAVRELLRRTGPAILGVGVFQFSVLLTQGLAFIHGPQIVSSFNYAVRLMELPQGLVGLSLATVLLSELSQLSAEKKYPEFRSTLKEGLLQLVFLTLVPVVTMLILAEPIVRLLFERGRFDTVSTMRVSEMLVALGPGLLAFSLNNLLARAFYALGDTSTPMKVGMFSVIITILSSIFLLRFFPGSGLGMANSLGAIANAILLTYAFRRKLPLFKFGELRSPVSRMVWSAVVAAAVMWGTKWAWERWVGHANLAAKLGEVVIPALLGGGSYLAVTLALGLAQPREIIAVASAWFSGDPKEEAGEDTQP